MSWETPKIKNTTPSLGGCNIEDFTVRVVAVKAFLTNEIYELKQEIESLKEKLNVGKLFPVTKMKKVYLKIQFSLL